MITDCSAHEVYRIMKISKNRSSQIGFAAADIRRYLMENPRESEQFLSGFPRQLFTSLHGFTRDVFLRHGDADCRHLDADSGK